MAFLPEAVDGLRLLTCLENLPLLGAHGAPGLVLPTGCLDWAEGHLLKVRLSAVK